LNKKEVASLLAYELYLKNKESTVEAVKTVVPIKKIFVRADNRFTVQLDSKTLEHYGEYLNPKNSNFFFQEALSMPSNNLASVGLPYRGTGAAAKKPYIEFFGNYNKGKLKISIAGEGNDGKQKYEYLYSPSNAKETFSVPVDSLVLKLDKKSYFANNNLLFDAYREAGIINAECALFSKVFIEVCRAFSSLWNEKIAPEGLKVWSSFIFRIIVLPFSLLPDGNVEYRSDNDGDFGEEFEDCFGNRATDFPSKATINAKFVSFDDKAFSINCKTGKEFYQNLSIGNESFPKIFLPSDNGIRIAGLDWYFFDISEPSLRFAAKGSGIYDQLLSNYIFLSKRSGKSVIHQSALKVLCTKRAQAKLEVLLDENLTLDQLKEMFSRIEDNMTSHPLALESLIIENNKSVIWTDYIIAIRYFMNGTYFSRAVLVQRFTHILRNNIWDWIKSNKSSKKDKSDFFIKSQFCLNLLTKNESGLVMNKNEQYAYQIGVIAGKYVKFKRGNNEANNSTNDILTYSKYDRERLRFVYQRVGIGVSLSKVNTDSLSKSIKNDLPKEEIDETQAHEDYSYFFFKGVFENLT
jgi:hypothetical protein